MAKRLQLYVNPAYDLQLEDVLDELDIHPKWTMAGSNLKIEVNISDKDVEAVDKQLIGFKKKFPQAQLMYTLTPVFLG